VIRQNVEMSLKIKQMERERDNSGIVLLEQQRQGQTIPTNFTQLLENLWDRKVSLVLVISLLVLGLILTRHLSGIVGS